MTNKYRLPSKHRYRSYVDKRIGRKRRKKGCKGLETESLESLDYSIASIDLDADLEGDEEVGGLNALEKNVDDSVDSVSTLLSSNGPSLRLDSKNRKQPTQKKKKSTSRPIFTVDKEKKMVEKNVAILPAILRRPVVSVSEPRVLMSSEPSSSEPSSSEPPSSSQPPSSQPSSSQLALHSPRPKSPRPPQTISRSLLHSLPTPIFAHVLSYMPTWTMFSTILTSSITIKTGEQFKRMKEIRSSLRLSEMFERHWDFEVKRHRIVRGEKLNRGDMDVDVEVSATTACLFINILVVACSPHCN